MDTTFIKSFSLEVFFDDDQEPDFYKYILDNHMDEVCEVISKRTGFSTDKILNEYEGGIREWFGPGSVGRFELGMAFRITEGPEDNVTFEILE